MPFILTRSPNGGGAMLLGPSATSSISKPIGMVVLKVIGWFFRLSSLRRRHARPRAAGRAGRRVQWEVWYFDHAWSAGALGFARFLPLLTSVNFTGSCSRGRQKYFNLSDALLSCRYPVVPCSTQVQEVGVEQWHTRRRHCLGFQREDPSSEFRSPSSGRKPPTNSSVVSQQHAATQYKTERS